MAAIPRLEEMTSSMELGGGGGGRQRAGREEGKRGREEGGGGWIQSSAKHYSKYITNVPCGATRVPAHLLSQ